MITNPRPARQTHHRVVALFTQPEKDGGLGGRLEQVGNHRPIEAGLLRAL